MAVQPAVLHVASPPKIADSAIVRDVPVLTAAADVEAQVEDGRLPDALTEQSQIVFGASGGPELLAIASGRDTNPVSTAYTYRHLRLIKTVVQEPMSETVTERGLRASTRRLSARADDFGRRMPGAVALVAVVVVFAYPLARSSRATRSEFLLVGVGVPVAALAFMRLRSAIARRSAVRTRHYPCIPALVVALAAIGALLELGVL